MLWILVTVLTLCLLSSAGVFYFLLRDEKSNEKRKLEQSSRIEQLERELNEKTKEHEGLYSQLRNEFNVKEKNLTAEISTLKEQLTSTNDTLIKEQLNKQTIEKDLEKFKSESEKLKRDLSLTSQMYEGLKTQYNELERLTAKPSKSPKEQKLAN
jgi:predicted  nucleic acid-binding Zn-ribbon protein